MSNDEERGTSRSGFLKQAAGATIVVAGAGIGAGAVASGAAASRSNAAGHHRSYTAGRFALELDGVNVGAMVGVDGGDLELDVVLDPVGSDNVQRKHIGGVKYEDFTVQVGSGMDAAMYNWIKASFDKGGAVSRACTIVTGDSNFNEQRRRAASTASISSVTIPGLDGASKDPAYLAVSISCDKVTEAPPSGQPVQAAKQKAWLPANFVFEIDGVDTSRVASIDSFTWKCAAVQAGSPPAPPDCSDISVRFPASRLSSWQKWYDSLASGADDERDGTLTLIGAHDGAVITVGLFNLGLYRLLPTVNKKSFTAEMYVERMSWDLKKGTKV